MKLFFELLFACLSYYFVGVLWYSSFLFGNLWADTLGLSKKHIKQLHADASKVYFSSFVSSFVTVLVLWYVLFRTSHFVLSSSLRMTIILWIGFVAARHLDFVLFEKRPVKLYLINVFGLLAQLVVATLVLCFTF